MHHTIQMIPIEALEHHPENPRKDLGDLKELIASIKESGVMQNLTVGPNPDDEETWLVVIGNRRLEASKAAGLTELPCIISDMDHKTQLATMMAENMQRVDLTLTEQAQGVQLMMDLGMDAKEISKRTGLRKDAVERRAMMAKYDTAKAAAAIVRGGTISDFMELEKLPEDCRDEMLEYVGTNNLRLKIKDKLAQLKQQEYRQQMYAKLETFATRVERQGYVGAKAVPMDFVTSWYTLSSNSAALFTIPEDVKDRHYYYVVDNGGYFSIKLYKEDTSTQDERAEATRRRQLRSDYMSMRADQAQALDRKLRNLRYEWLFSSGDVQWNQAALMRALVKVLGTGKWHSSYRDEQKEMTEQLTGLTLKNSGYASFVKLEDLHGMSDEKMLRVGVGLLWGSVDRDNYVPWERDYDNSCLAFRRSDVYEIVYDLLLAMGYEMSDEEAAYLGGTHEVYKPYEEVEGR